MAEASTGSDTIHLALIDISLSPRTGIDVIRHLREIAPEDFRAVLYQE